MKSKNLQRGLSLVTVASATCFSAVLLAGCGGGNGGLSSTPTTVEPNATVPFSAFAGPDAKSDAYTVFCPRHIVQWEDPGGREYFAHFRYVKIHASTIPSEPGVSYECAFAGKYGMEYRTTKLSPEEFVKRLLEPQRWGHHYGPGSFACEILDSDCGFVIGKKN